MREKRLYGNNKENILFVSDTVSCFCDFRNCMARKFSQHAVAQRERCAELLLRADLILQAGDVA